MPHHCDAVEPAEQLVEHSHQLLWCAGTCQLRKAHNVCIEDAAQIHTHNYIEVLQF